MKQCIIYTIGFALFAVLSGCVLQVGTVRTQLDLTLTNPSTQIRNILGRQVADWNRGDIESFMHAYWQSPDLTFSSGGRITRGWQNTLDNYHQRYPNRKVMGHLEFSFLEITPIEIGAALVLGRWYLDRDEPIGGAFSLVFRKVHGRWVIVHDHTSVDKKKFQHDRFRANR